MNNPWLDRVRALDAKLQPIANRPIRFEEIPHLDPRSRPRPLDEAGIRPEAESLLLELIDAYAAGDDATRAEIRALFGECRAFAWAVAVPEPRDTLAGLRARLVHFSIKDQERDPRDATLSLDAIVRDARQAGVDLRPMLAEVAAMSSTEDRYGWGSTREWLLKRLTRGRGG